MIDKYILNKELLISLIGKGFVEGLAAGYQNKMGAVVSDYKIYLEENIEKMYLDIIHEAWGVNNDTD